MVEISNTRTESAIAFDCSGDKLFGVLHEGATDASIGVLIVVGGRQYRAGAHRQFVLLARHLASCDIPAMRFDVRGMGDSEGQIRHFLSLDEDIAQAAATFILQVPGLKKLVLWGLCDGASAAIIYAPSNPLVVGVMLVNPWISTDSGIAKSYLKHYYRKRLTDPAFWRKVMSGDVNWRSSLMSLRQTLRSMIFSSSDDNDAQSPLPDIVFDALSDGKIDTCIVVSDRDLTAREFEDEHRRRLDAGLLSEHESRVFIRISADHTFSDLEAHKQLCEQTVNWVQSLD